MEHKREIVSINLGRTSNAGDFFSKLSPDALRDLQAIQRPSNYPQGVVLFSERETPAGVFIILSGEVKLTMNSVDGKRLILRIAKAGEMLGLVSAVSGGLAEMTAETAHPARIAVVECREFLSFLNRHPEVYQILTVELSRHLNRMCEQLRTVGLSASAPEKLARLLLDWSENGQTTDAGTRFHFPLTHEEIGEFIGASRETVTRTMTTFKLRRLVVCHGTSFTISDRTALESYARC